MYNTENVRGPHFTWKNGDTRSPNLVTPGYPSAGRNYLASKPHSIGKTPRIGSLWDCPGSSTTLMGTWDSPTGNRTIVGKPG